MDVNGLVANAFDIGLNCRKYLRLQTVGRPQPSIFIVHLSHSRASIVVSDLFHLQASVAGWLLNKKFVSRMKWPASIRFMDLTMRTFMMPSSAHQASHNRPRIHRLEYFSSPLTNAKASWSDRPKTISARNNLQPLAGLLRSFSMAHKNVSLSNFFQGPQLLTSKLSAVFTASYALPLYRGKEADDERCCSSQFLKEAWVTAALKSGLPLLYSSYKIPNVKKHARIV